MKQCTQKATTTQQVVFTYLYLPINIYSKENTFFKEKRLLFGGWDVGEMRFRGARGNKGERKVIQLYFN